MKTKYKLMVKFEDGQEISARVNSFNIIENIVKEAGIAKEIDFLYFDKSYTKSMVVSFSGLNCNAEFSEMMKEHRLGR